MDKHECIHCKELNKEKMYNPFICIKCREEWEEHPYLS